MDLIEVTKLFNAHNRSRMERLIELAPPSHQTFLQLLPLVFQSNDAALPCYVEGAPFGIVDYQPSDQLLAFAKKNHPSLSYSKHAFRQYPLQGLYLINESGSLAYPSEPEFDLWLVYSSANTEQQIQLLNTKLDAVVLWAQSLDIKLNVRLLSDATVKDYKIESDDLDRFYSSGLILAGSVPLWWLLTPEQELDYQRHAPSLSANPPVDASILDFGPLGQRSASVVVDSAIKASLATIEHGLPCYLELFYQQHLAQNLADNLWLSPRYKQAVYSQETNTFFCEPSILKFDMVSEKLSDEFSHYLKQALYLLCNERLSKNVTSPRYPWRRENIKDLVSEWRWSNTELLTLDQRNQAPIRLCLNEFSLTKTVTRQLNDAIKLLIKNTVPDAANKIATLQKAYQDIYDSPPDVIPSLPDSLIPEVSEDFLFVEYEPSSQQWTINEIERASLRKSDPFTPLHSSPSLVLTVAWAIINGALSKHTRVKLISNNNDVSTTTLFSLVEHLLKSPVATEPPSDETLCWLMFANSEQTPKEAYKQQDIKLSMRLRDPLNYSYHRRNMVMQLEVLVRTDNKVWHYLSYDKANTTGEVLAALIRWQSNEMQQNYLDCWCPTPHFAASVKKRLTTLGQYLCEHFQHSPESGIYLLEVGDRLCRIQWQQQQVDSSFFARRYDLNTILSLARSELSTTHVDPYLDPEGLYALLLKEQDTGHIRVFIDAQKSHIDYYILDELGHLDQQTTSLKEQTLLTNLNQFFTATPSNQNHVKPHFYKLHNTNGIWTIKSLVVPQIESNDNYLPVQVTMEQAKTDSQCTIVCGPKSFTGQTNDPVLFEQVSQFIRNLRKSSNSFSLYITALSFQQTTPITTTHDHLVFKHYLENQLNRV